MDASADLSSTDIPTFLSHLNGVYSLHLPPVQLKHASRVFSEQWFSFASELRQVDKDTLQNMNIPIQLVNAILRFFNTYNTPMPTQTPTNIHGKNGSFSNINGITPLVVPPASPQHQRHHTSTQHSHSFSGSQTPQQQQQQPYQSNNGYASATQGWATTPQQQQQQLQQAQQGQSHNHVGQMSQPPLTPSSSMFAAPMPPPRPPSYSNSMSSPPSQAQRPDMYSPLSRSLSIPSPTATSVPPSPASFVPPAAEAAWDDNDPFASLAPKDLRANQTQSQPTPTAATAPPPLLSSLSHPSKFVEEEKKTASPPVLRPSVSLPSSLSTPPPPPFPPIPAVTAAATGAASPSPSAFFPAFEEGGAFGSDGNDDRELSLNAALGGASDDDQDAGDSDAEVEEEEGKNGEAEGVGNPFDSPPQSPLASPNANHAGPKKNNTASLLALKQAVEHACSTEIKDEAVLKSLQKLLRQAMKGSGKITQSVLREHLKRVQTASATAVASGGDKKQGSKVKDKKSSPSNEEEKEEKEVEHSMSSLSLTASSSFSSSMNAMLEEKKMSGSSPSGSISIGGSSGPQCDICHTRHAVSQPYRLDCHHTFNTSCLSSYVMSLVNAKQAVSITCPSPVCGKELSAANIQAILSADDFETYLQATLMAFIEQDGSSFICPNDACKSVISIAPFNPVVPAVITEKDDDGKLLSKEAYLHFCEFRVRCRDCSTIFCAQCKKTPYHKGYTCAQFKEYQSARHCRFCSARLDTKNTWKNPSGAVALRDICTDAECMKKAEVCCDKMLACGCPCNGIRNESTCLPCLKHDLEIDEEYCPICYVEALKDAPCIQMTGPCTHTFHYTCVVTKIEAKWPGARISFEFRTCPVCKQNLVHTSLEKILAPIIGMEASIHDKALQRLKYEGRENDPAIINKTGEYYNNMVGFAMKMYLFYQCFKCQRPYFAGGYQCQEANVSFDPAELICPSCQPSSVEDCKIHGKDWLAYKCRYCCTFANWYCVAAGCKVGLTTGLSIPIESMTTKDRILTYQEALLDQQQQPQARGIIDGDCMKLYDQSYKPCIELLFNDGRTLCVTEDHKIMTTQGMIRADGLSLHRSLILAGPDAPLDAVDSEHERSFEYRLLHLDHHLHMRTVQARQTTLAFARVCGLLLGCKDKLQWNIDTATGVSDMRVSFDHRYDVNQFRQDCYLLTGISSEVDSTSSGINQLRLTPQLVADIATAAGVDITAPLRQLTPFPSLVLSPCCPLSVVREFLASFFGCFSKAPCPHPTSPSEFQSITLTTDTSLSEYRSILEIYQQIQQLLLRFQIPLSAWRVDKAISTKSTTAQTMIQLMLRLSNKQIVKFNDAIGFRYDGWKQMQLTAAAAFYRRKATVTRVQRNGMIHPSASAMILPEGEINRPPASHPAEPNPAFLKMPNVAEFLSDIHAGSLFRKSSVLRRRNESSLPVIQLQLISRKPVGLRHVYDIAVPSTHNFCANGIVVSNCWGNSHFCDKCHKSGVWQQLCVFRSGKNKKKLWEYDNCASLKPLVEAIGKDTSLTDDQKTEKCGKLLSAPKACVLGVRHPPNGIEFGLGCSMCEDSQSSSEKLKENEAAIKAKLMTVKNELLRAPKTFHYQSDFDVNGVMFYLGTCGKTQKYTNPAEAGFVKVTSSGLMGDSAPLSAAVGRELVRCVTTPVRNSWFVFELVDLSLCVTAYTLRHYNSWDTECLRDWLLEGSNDALSGKWDTIAVHKSDTALAKKGATHTWFVNSQGKAFKYFRLFQTGRNSNNNFYLACSGMEMYGTLYLNDPAMMNNNAEQGVMPAMSPHGGALLPRIMPIAPPPNFRVPSIAAPPPPIMVANQATPGYRQFNYQRDFDENGICYFLGTRGGSLPIWTNPADLGVIRVTCSELCVNPVGAPISAVVGRDVVRVVSVSKPNQWFVIDFTASGYRIRPTAYTLRHYNSWDLEALRNWKFEGSLNGHEWFVLRVHEDDRHLDRKGASHTWQLPNQQGQFTMFRIWQTGFNSNNHHYLALSGFEIYGTLIENKIPLSNPFDQVRMALSGAPPPTPPVAMPMVPYPGNMQYQGQLGHPHTHPHAHLQQQPQAQVGHPHPPPHMPSPPPARSHPPAPVPVPASSPHLEPTGMMHFRYQYDMDTNGLFYYLGTGCRRHAWTNPADLHLVSATASALAVNPPSAPASAIFGREAVRCVTLAKPDMWFCIDLQANSLQPSHYTLQHYTSWDTEALRNWKLEGSQDGHVWDVIRLHENDQALQRKGQTFTWPLPPTPLTQGKFYRYFRIYQTGPNSNTNHYLALSGVEFYGMAIIGGQRPPHMQQPQQQPPSLPMSSPPSLPASRPSLSRPPSIAPPPPPQPHSSHPQQPSVHAPSPIAANQQQQYDNNNNRNRSIGSNNPFDDAMVAPQPAQPPRGSQPAPPQPPAPSPPYHHPASSGQYYPHPPAPAPAAPSPSSSQRSSLPTAASSNNPFDSPSFPSSLPAGGPSLNPFALPEPAAGPPPPPLLSRIQPALPAASQPFPVAQRTPSSSSSSFFGPGTHFVEGMEFVYHYDFDEDGILYYIGTKQRSAPWRNPDDLGAVKVTSVPLAVNPPSAPASAIVGREVVRCVTLPNRESWFCIDLLTWYVRPTAYTLRHYDSFDSEALRDWKLQGSNDGKKWTKLSSHKKDESLNGKGSSHTWQIPDTRKSFRMFRILQTGKNSNGHWYCALSGFELYGQLFTVRQRDS